MPIIAALLGTVIGVLFGTLEVALYLLGAIFRLLGWLLSGD
jgi:hypothetical protein